MASKFFEHFVAICESTNTFGGTGLWDEEDGFYYDQLKIDGRSIPLKTRSLVGLLPLVAVEVLEEERIESFKGFRHRMDWFLKYRRDLAEIDFDRQQIGPQPSASWLFRPRNGSAEF